MIYYKHAHEGDLFLSLPLVVLAVFSIFFGYITKDIFIGLGSSFFIDNSIFIHPVHEIMIETEFGVPTMFKLLPLGFTVFFSALAIIVSEYLPESLINFKFSKLGYNIFGFFNQRFLIEMFYNKYITNLVLNLGGQTTKVLDKGAIELVGPFGMEIGLVKLSKKISSLSTGVALFILIGLITYILVAYLSQENFDLVLLFILGLFSLTINFSSPKHEAMHSSLWIYDLIKINLPLSVACAQRDIRNYSTRPSNEMERKDFLEWFAGFTDGEGCFSITKNNEVNYLFKFDISLHIDDVNTLKFIQNSLGLGSVKEYTSLGFATFRITKQNEILEIIKIFDSVFLNTTKYYNFLAFKKAFFLYTSSSRTEELVLEIEDIRSNMNSKRAIEDLNLSSSHEVRVTSYWLLGFVEAEGSFFVNRVKNFPVVFSVSQVSMENSLLEKIREFILALPGNYKVARLNSNVVGIYVDEARGNSKPHSHISIRHPDFIRNVLIPFFDSLKWQSKKELDYKDWKTVLTLKEDGKHFMELGVKVINGILDQMNNNRLSTNLKRVDNQEWLTRDLNHLLSLPSNLKVEPSGKIFIISQGKYYQYGGNLAVQLVDSNNTVIKEFDSLTECAKYLEKGKSTISRILASGKPLSWKGQTYYVIRSINNPVESNLHSSTLGLLSLLTVGIVFYCSLAVIFYYNTEFAVPVLFKLLPLAFTVSFSILALILSEYFPESLISFKFSKLGYNIFGFFNQRFLVEMFYNKYITNLVLNLGGQTTKVLDKGSIELLGPFGLELGLIKLSKNISSLSTGVVTSYALYILIGVITYLIFNVYLVQIEWNLVLLIILTGFSLMAFSTEESPITRKV